MPTSPLTRTTGRTDTDARLFTLLDLQAEADRLMTTARRADARDGTSPWAGDQYAGYRIRAEAVGGLLEGMRAGRTPDQAVADGAESGRRAVADYLRDLLTKRI